MYIIFHARMKKEINTTSQNHTLNCYLGQLICSKWICKKLLVQNTVLWARTDSAAGIFKMKMTCFGHVHGVIWTKSCVYMKAMAVAIYATQIKSKKNGHIIVLINLQWERQNNTIRVWYRMWKMTYKNN